ncbi:hypothetical protein HN911_13365 [Candidatus Bathyarchaeota archaeon]|jgi:hypothetical protein|nr:hypothetical protein [Candidatus Bathyarchaeota archaeon]
MRNPVSWTALILAILAIAVQFYPEGKEKEEPKAVLTLDVRNDSLVLESNLPPTEASLPIIRAFESQSGNVINRARVVIDSLSFVNLQLSKIVATQSLHIQGLQAEVSRLDSLAGEGR